MFISSELLEAQCKKKFMPPADTFYSMYQVAYLKS